MCAYFASCVYFPFLPRSSFLLTWLLITDSDSRSISDDPCIITGLSNAYDSGICVIVLATPTEFSVSQCWIFCSPTMAHCLRCSSELTADIQSYITSDLGFDIIRLIEHNLGFEVDGDSALCSECFETIIQGLSTDYELIYRQDNNVCVMCYNSLYQRRRHSLGEVALNYVAERIMPRQIPAGALVCHACWMQIRSFFESDQLDLPLEQPNTCVWCNRSLNRTRTHSLPEGPERNFIIARINPREIPLEGRVCYACWVAARRNILREQNNETPQSGNPQQHRHSICVWCQSSLFRRISRRLLPGPERSEVANRIYPRQLPAQGALLCEDCWRQAQLNVQYEAQIQAQDQAQLIEPPPPLPPSRNVTLSGFFHTTNSSVSCFVPECSNPERHRVPKYIKLRILKSHKIFVMEGARICTHHKSIYNWEFLEQQEFSNTFMTNEIEAMLRLSIEEEDYLHLDFESFENIPDNIFKYWTGLTKDNFSIILTNISPALTYKSPKTALGVYLMKLRTGDSHERIGSLMGMTKSKVSKINKIAREALLRLFVPIHLGLNHMSRAELIAHNLVIPEGLFGDREQRVPIIICDGTYIYLQKSSNYLFQKKTYSLHKYRNLVKPFLMVAPDGYILDVLGPYPATESDADIMKALFQDNTEHRNYFQRGDVFILDRGFRDVISHLEEIGYKVHKPESLNQGETQLPTIRANQSRCVTLCRWVVEVVNGRFKRDYKLLRQNYFNCAATHLMDDVRICAALINAFHPLIRDRPDAEIILNRAQSRLEMPNLLANLINENRINRFRAQFQRIDAQHGVEIFPEMTMEDLTIFALGIYQIKQARSYYGEHLRQHGSFQVEISTELEVVSQAAQSQHDPLLIRARIKSRHHSNKTYYTYILIQNEGSCWDEKIVSYYCNCVAGQRTVGCCAHIMTVVWYLGWARNQPNIQAPACFLDGILVRDEIENE